MQLLADPTGGFGVQLTQLVVNGRAFHTASSAAVLAPDAVGFLRNHTRAAGAPQDSVAGPRVFLPTDTLVRFTLHDAPAEPASSSLPSQQARAPEGPSMWQPTPPPYASPEAGGQAVSLAVTATNGGRRGRAHLTFSCTHKSFLAAYFTIAQPLLGYKVDDYNDGSDMGDTPLGRLTINGGPETNLFFSGNTGDDAPVRLNIGGPKNGFPDSFFSADSAGKAVKLVLLPPDKKGSPTVVAFVAPADPAPLLAVSSACFAGQAQEAAEAKAKIVASCPDRPGKALVDAKVRAMPGGRLFDFEPSDEGFGGGWDVTSPPMKAGQHAVLECIYGPPGSAPGSEPKVVAPANRTSVTLPADTNNCGVGGNPVTVTCSRK